MVYFLDIEEINKLCPDLFIGCLKVFLFDNLSSTTLRFHHLMLACLCLLGKLSPFVTSVFFSI